MSTNTTNTTNQIEIPKTAMTGYPIMPECDLSYPEIKTETEDYICVGILKSSAVYHKKYEYFGEPDNPKILFYSYKNGEFFPITNKEIRYLPNWLQESIKTVLLKYRPELFL